VTIALEHVDAASIPEAQAVGDDELFELLAAYQFMQGQNARMATAISVRLGLSATDLRVLLFVHRAPDATPKEIAGQLEQTSSSVTAMLDRLERSGHLTRSPHPTDRRSLVLNLTAAGRGAAEAVRGAYRHAFAGVFSAEQISQVAGSLRAIGGALTVP
jgi:DNA-binding MarR family transcriptional regulator